MNIKELRQLLDAVKDVIDDDTEVCLDDSRDGIKSYPEARVFLTKNSDGKNIVAIGYV